MNYNRLLSQLRQQPELFDNSAKGERIYNLIVRCKDKLSIVKDNGQNSKRWAAPYK